MTISSSEFNRFEDTEHSVDHVHRVASLVNDLTYVIQNKMSDKAYLPNKCTAEEVKTALRIVLDKAF